MTKPYAEVIGDPIAHSKSPLIHKFWLAKLGIDAEYRAFHVRPHGLAGYFSQRRRDAAWRGCNVTIPHKQQVADNLDTLDQQTQRVGAVNTVYPCVDGRLVGANTDIAGVEEAVGGLSLYGEDICVLGCGGAARSALAYLATTRCQNVYVLARDAQKAANVAGACGLGGATSVGVPFEAGSTALCEARLFVNATQLGMAGQEPMPSFVLDELDELAADALVFDMVYSPLETALLAAARRKRIRTADGLTMLVGQAAVAFTLFFGAPAPREHDAELRALLTA